MRSLLLHGGVLFVAVATMLGCAAPSADGRNELSPTARSANAPNDQVPSTNADDNSAPPQAPAAAVVDVREEGAIGDGIADDAKAVQAALAKGALLDRVVVFPAGRYRLAESVKVALLANQKLVVHGRDDAALVSGTAQEPGGEEEVGLLDITGAGNQASSEVDITHLSIELAQTARGLRNGVALHGGMSRVVLEDVAVRGASRWGIAVERARSGTITSCRAENNRYGGLGLNASSNIKVTGGVYSNNGTTAPVDGYGISCMSSVIGPCVGVTISGVHADANKRKGIDVHSGHDILIDGNFVSGFDSSGIYAVNEDPGKDVKDITITNNVIDGAGASHYIYGIEVGAFSALATPSGTFTVRGNTIRNTSFTTSSAVMIRNPTAPGLAPTRVVIDKNVVDNGAAPDAYIIRGDNYDVPVGEIVVTDNKLSASFASVGIGLLRVSTATVERNTITIGSGSVAYGILVSAPASASIANNMLVGDASYGVPIASAAQQVLRMNFLRGGALADAN